MVICDPAVIEVCPVEWARMDNRTVLHWDKHDCAAVGLVKFDLLGLGMLSALHYAFDMIDSQLDLRRDGDAAARHGAGCLHGSRRQRRRLP
jgi:error-prone DNA polymerase